MPVGIKIITIMIFLLMISGTQAVSESGDSNPMFAGIQYISRFDADESAAHEAAVNEAYESENEIENEPDPVLLEDDEWEDPMQQEELDMDETAPAGIETDAPHGVSDDEENTENPVDEIETFNN